MATDSTPENKALVTTEQTTQYTYPKIPTNDQGFFLLLGNLYDVQAIYGDSKEIQAAIESMEKILLEKKAWAVNLADDRKMLWGKLSTDNINAFKALIEEKINTANDEIKLKGFETYFTLRRIVFTDAIKSYSVTEKKCGTSVTAFKEKHPNEFETKEQKFLVKESFTLLNSIKFFTPKYQEFSQVIRSPLTLMNFTSDLLLNWAETQEKSIAATDHLMSRGAAKECPNLVQNYDPAAFQFSTKLQLLHREMFNIMEKHVNEQEKNDFQEKYDRSIELTERKNLLKKSFSEKTDQDHWKVHQAEGKYILSIPMDNSNTPQSRAKNTVIEETLTEELAKLNITKYTIEKVDNHITIQLNETLDAFTLFEKTGIFDKIAMDKNSDFSKKIQQYRAQAKDCLENNKKKSAEKYEKMAKALTKAHNDFFLMSYKNEKQPVIATKKAAVRKNNKMIFIAECLKIVEKDSQFNETEMRTLFEGTATNIENTVIAQVAAEVKESNPIATIKNIYARPDGMIRVEPTLKNNILSDDQKKTIEDQGGTIHHENNKFSITFTDLQKAETFLRRYDKSLPMDYMPTRLSKLISRYETQAKRLSGFRHATHYERAANGLKLYFYEHAKDIRRAIEENATLPDNEQFVARCEKLLEECNITESHDENFRAAAEALVKPIKKIIVIESIEKFSQQAEENSQESKNKTTQKRRTFTLPKQLSLSEGLKILQEYESEPKPRLQSKSKSESDLTSAKKTRTSVTFKRTSIALPNNQDSDNNTTAIQATQGETIYDLIRTANKPKPAADLETLSDSTKEKINKTAPSKKPSRSSLSALSTKSSLFKSVSSFFSPHKKANRPKSSPPTADTSPSKKT
jgi:hypothetical protein